jgi:hypothetical protein
MEFFGFRPIQKTILAAAVAVAGAIPALTFGAICAASMVFTFATPCSAQIVIQLGGPQVRGFSDNYPWFNDVPQKLAGERRFRGGG